MVLLCETSAAVFFVLPRDVYNTMKKYLLRKAWLQWQVGIYVSIFQTDIMSFCAFFFFLGLGFSLD